VRGKEQKREFNVQGSKIKSKIQSSTFKEQKNQIDQIDQTDQ
jgi:hypothetical protein